MSKRGKSKPKPKSGEQVWWAYTNAGTPLADTEARTEHGCWMKLLAKVGPEYATKIEQLKAIRYSVDSHTKP